MMKRQMIQSGLSIGQYSDSSLWLEDPHILIDIIDIQLDFFAAAIMRTFPIYFLFKALFLMYLFMPQTEGAEVLYAVSTVLLDRCRLY